MIEWLFSFYVPNAFTRSQSSSETKIVKNAQQAACKQRA